MIQSAPLKDWSRATYEDEEDELACSQTPLAQPILKVRAASVSRDAVLSLTQPLFARSGATLL